MSVLAAMSICSLASAETNYTVLRSFGFVDQAGESPDVLIEGADGVLYGSAEMGLIGGRLGWKASPDHFPRGIVFRMQKDGSGYEILHRFAQTNQTAAELVYGTNGVLYGTTYRGGTVDRGTVFKLNTDGTGFAVLHDFAGGSMDGEGARGLVQGSDGMLYGTTVLGGASPLCGGGCGVAFRMNPDGSAYAILRSLAGGTEGRHPVGLEEASDGMLYGTTQKGGAFDLGTIFKIEKDGGNYATILSFDGANGGYLETALLEGSDGALYGTTVYGGAADAGTLFRLNTDGTGHQVLHYFGGVFADGREPWSRLVEGSDGTLYGSSVFTGTIFKVNKDGTGYSVLHSSVAARRLVWATDGVLYGTQKGKGFTGVDNVFRIAGDGNGYVALKSFTQGAGDGTGPFVVIEGRDRSLYGLTFAGGQDVRTGTAFRVGKDGTGYMLLHFFPYAPSQPRSLIEGSDGMLYGSVDYGGTFGGGVIFRMNKDGSGFDTIVNFGGTNGQKPSEGLIEGSDDALYGNTEGGGSAGRGVVFKVNKDGAGYAVLHSFTGNGPGPSYGLLEATDGWLYGATHFTGSADQGMIFKLKKDGSSYQEIHHFTDLGSAGGGPCGGLIEGSNGELYGTTIAGGDAEVGTIFKVKKDGTGYRRLLSFPAGTWYFLESKRVMQASDGVLYGVTYTGGRVGQGMLFRISPDGSGYSVLHDFVNVGADGGGPWGGMMEGSDGALYGTTSWGGALNVGTMFRFVPPPEVISVTRQAKGPMRVIARALSGRIVAIEGSTDLISWSEIDSGAAVDGRLTVDDLDARQFGHRFYRARLKDL